MKLTKEQQSSVLSKLNEYKDKRRPCSICGNNNWTLSDTVFEIREFTKGIWSVEGPLSTMPLIAVSCTECGHTKFISAIKIGIIQPTNSSDTESSDANPND